MVASPNDRKRHPEACFSRARQLWPCRMSCHCEVKAGQLAMTCYKVCNGQVHPVSDEYFLALFGKCLLLSTGIIYWPWNLSSPDLHQAAFISNSPIWASGPSKRHLSMGQGMDFCVQKNTPLQAMQVRVVRQPLARVASLKSRIGRLGTSRFVLSPSVFKAN